MNLKQTKAECLPSLPSMNLLIISKVLSLLTSEFLWSSLDSRLDATQALLQA